MQPRILSLFLVVHLLSPAHAQDKKKPFTVSDLYLMESVKNLTLSPSGKELVYVRTWIDSTTRLERHSLWRVPGKRDDAKPLEADEPDARSPVYSPDGKWIAFLSTRPRPTGWKQIPPTPPESDAATDIWLIPSEGGPAIPLAGADKAYGRVFSDNFYSRIAFDRDGKRLVFIADDGTDPRTTQELTNDVIVVRPDQGEGYTGFGPAQVWIAHLELDKKSAKFAAPRIDRLTKDDIYYGDPQWSPDGKLLVVHANKTNDRESVRFSINRDFDLFAIDLDTKAQRQLTFGPGPDVSPRFAPDGKKLAFLSVPRKGSHRDAFNLCLINLADKSAMAQTLFDHHGPKADKPPHPSPAFPLPEDCWEGDSITFQAEVKTGSALARVQLPEAAATELTVNKAMQAKRFAELRPQVNAFLKDRLVAESRVITWKSDNLDIEGILTTPPVGIAKPPYKLIVYPHGGPHSRSTLGFDVTVQVFAGQGYAVFQPNFRGSSGYGQKFIDADRNDLGGGDMRDILNGIDLLVKQGQADRSRQFVYGISYGGFMTTWLVGQTTQFRAAAAQNAVTDLHMMWSLSDIPSWTTWEFGGLPWQSADAMKKFSPLTHVAKVKTPTLILHSRDDRRCPLPMGLAYHQALQFRGIPTQMVIYPNEGHGIRNPRHREDVLQRVLGWFAKYEKK